jgi:ribosomal protein S27E
MVDYYDVDGEKGMKCPECGNNKIPFIKAWIAGSWFNLACPGCHAKLKVHKTGLSRFSSCVIGISIGILIILWKFNVYHSPTVFVPAAIFLLVLDLFIDRKFMILKKRPAQK